MTRRGLAAAVAVAVAGVLLPGARALAFPPYRTTDAGTADGHTIEARLGLAALRLDAGRATVSSPLLRLNFGLPHAIEIVSELEMRPRALPLGLVVSDAAIGMKWVPVARPFGLGVEILALLPVTRPGSAGVEAQALATIAAGKLRVHLNAGGAHDARESRPETAVRGSVLAEGRFGRFRPGVELFAKQARGAPLQALAGTGVIVKLGAFDVRAGAHVGLTAASPDFRASVWVSGALVMP